MHRSLFLIGASIFFLLFSGCTKEDQDLPDPISFTFTVIDDNNVKINGAMVCFYDNEQSYNNALLTNKFSGYTDSLTSVATSNLLSLQDGKDYWVIVRYFDPIRNINLANLGGKLDHMEKGSEVIANILITPLDGFISFWSPIGNKFSITITLNGVNFSLLDGRTSVPTAFDTTNTVTLPVPPGVYTYYAVADNQCVWSGSVTVNRNTFNPVELPICILGRITFVSQSIGAHGSLFVKLDDFDYLGDITTASDYTCGVGSGSFSPSKYGDYVTTTRPLGVYTYNVTSADGLCVKAGSISINSDTCIVINIPNCP